MGYLIFAIILIAIDQISKAMVLSNLGMGGSQVVIDGFFSLSVLQNRGIAFGLLQNHLEVVTCVTSALMGAILVYVFLNRKTERRGVLISLIMIAAGGIGNLIDRVRLGYVTDFLDFSIWNYVFNVADVCVVVGCFVLIFLMIVPSGVFSSRKNRRRRRG